MTYSLTQLEVIRVFGRKELTEGCIVFNEVLGEYSQFLRHWDGMYITSGVDGENCWHSDLCEILGHIPHLENVFRVAEDKGWNFYGNTEIVFIENIKKIPGCFYPDVCPKEYGRVKEYNPSISLLEQPEPVLIELLETFAK